MGIYDSYRQLELELAQVKRKLAEASAASEALVTIKEDQAAKDKKLAELSKVKAEVIKLRKEKKALQAKVKHLEKTLDALDKIVDEVDRKKE